MTENEKQIPDIANRQPATVVRYIPRSIEFVFYALVVVSMSSLFFWWTEEAPIAILERELLTNVVDIGGTVRIRNVVYISDDCEVDVRREFIDEAGTVHTVVSEDLPERQDETYVIFTSSVVVPHVVKPGKVIYRVWATWSCNFLQELFPTTVQLHDLEITVRE